MCLKILTDSECRKLIEEPFKILTAKFIKNVICADQQSLQRLQAFESQMSQFEKQFLEKYMSQAWGLEWRAMAY
jgi:hypothetical protein